MWTRVAKKVARRSFTVFTSSRFVIASRALSSVYGKSIRDILATEPTSKDDVTAQGWVKSVRPYKKVSFIEINDGTSHQNLQIVFTPELLAGLSSVTVGSCIEVTGQLRPSQGKGQAFELQANTVLLTGTCDAEEYPIKHRQMHPPEYMREILHLRPRTRHFASFLRIRNAASHAFHKYFQENGYIQIHTPAITSNDCEGAGEIFSVEPHQKMKMESDSDGDRKLFFNVPTFLTVSGQLHLEACTNGIRRVYTFGPTFRAENSRGRHHLSEFYMIEGELAFLRTTEDLAKVVEDLISEVTKIIFNHTNGEIDWYLEHHAPEGQKSLAQKLMSKNYIRMPYDEAVLILENAHEVFQFPIKRGFDFQKEHEQYLVKHCGDTPVFLTDFPAHTKPFYARLNEDGHTVGSLDLLCADVGEVCGGTLREERLEYLQHNMAAQHLAHGYQWYLDLRKFGTVPHGGFGIGFERYLQTLLGITNIREAIPFPRSPHNCRL